MHKREAIYLHALCVLLADLTATVGDVDDRAALPADRDGEASGHGD